VTTLADRLRLGDIFDTLGGAIAPDFGPYTFNNNPVVPTKRDVRRRRSVPVKMRRDVA